MHITLVYMQLLVLLAVLQASYYLLFHRAKLLEYSLSDPNPFNMLV